MFKLFMDEDFELISKEVIKKIREENRKLKTKLGETTKISGKKSKKETTKALTDIKKLIDEEAKKERALILENLSEIKEINQKTLESVIKRTENLDNRLEEMIGTIGNLVDSLKDVIEEVSGKDATSKIDEILDEIKEAKAEPGPTEKIDEIKTKLQEIETFMNNLKLLLAQIKPGDMSTK